VGDREREDSEALGDIFLHPGGKFGGGLGVGGNEMIEAGLSRGEIGAMEDGADVGSHAGAPIETGNVSLGVLLEVEQYLITMTWNSFSAMPKSAYLVAHLSILKKRKA
jgi:hypothetical protein